MHDRTDEPTLPFGGPAGMRGRYAEIREQVAADRMVSRIASHLAVGDTVEVSTDGTGRGVQMRVVRRSHT